MFRNRRIKYLAVIGAAAVLLALAAAAIAFYGERGAAPSPAPDNTPDGRQSGGVPPAGDEPGAADNVPAVDPGTQDAVRPGDPAPPPAKLVIVELFFADLAAAESGRPGDFGYVRPVERTLLFRPDVLRLALEELIRGPQPGEGPLGWTLPAAAEILNLEINDGLAIIDFSRAVLEGSAGGSLSGTVFTQSIVYTATQFPAVDRVIVLVEGHPWQEGHYFWDSALGREDLAP
jgi:hypothetical protein